MPSCLAVPYKAYPQLGQDYAKALAGKVVLDAGNATVARDGQELVSEVQQNGIGRTFCGNIFRVLRSCAPSTRSAIPCSRARRIVRETRWQSHRRRRQRCGCHRRRAGACDAGFEPVIVGGLDRAKEFQMGAPGYGQIVPASELKKKLGLSGLVPEGLGYMSELDASDDASGPSLVERLFQVRRDEMPVVGWSGSTSLRSCRRTT